MVRTEAIEIHPKSQVKVIPPNTIEIAHYKMGTKRESLFQLETKRMGKDIIRVEIPSITWIKTATY